MGRIGDMTDAQLDASPATVEAYESTDIQRDGTQTEMLELRAMVPQEAWADALASAPDAATLVAWIETNRA